MTRVFRSMLFVPGTRPDRFPKAEAARADAVVFDLEDSVPPARKAEARQLVGKWLATAPPSHVARVVRINGASTSFFDEDIEWLPRLRGCDAIMLPKADDTWMLEQAAHAIPSRTVIPLLESARGILNALALAGAKVTMPAVVFGGEDLTAEIGAERTVEGEELLFARSQVVLAAAALHADPIDGVFTAIGDDERLRQDARRARALGYRGKLAIHPTQVKILNEVFSPTADDVAHAQRIVDAYNEAAARGDGVLRLDNQMIDMPVVVRAKKLVELAQRIAKG